MACLNPCMVNIFPSSKQQLIRNEPTQPAQKLTLTDGQILQRHNVVKLRLSPEDHSRGNHASQHVLGRIELIGIVSGKPRKSFVVY